MTQKTCDLHVHSNYSDGTCKLSDFHRKGLRKNADIQIGSAIRVKWDDSKTIQEEYYLLYNGKYDVEFKCYRPKFEEVERVILGVHGFAGDKESSAINSLARAVVSEKTAVICFDFPAHGESPLKGDQLTVENCVRDLLLMAEYCRKEYPDARKMVYATSFGGYITLLCSEKLTDFKIALRGPAMTMLEYILLDILNLTSEEFKLHKHVQCGFERKIKLPYSFYEDLQKNRVMEKQQMDKMLIIHGSEDEVVPLSDIKEYCRTHPSELCIIDGADHRFKKLGELKNLVNITASMFSLLLNKKSTIGINI